MPPDLISDRLARAGLPVTRANWIDLNWWAEPPDPWTPEDEAELPPELQDWDVFEPIDDGAAVVAKRMGADAQWEESKHPRGQPGNAGEFGPGGGSKAAPAAKAAPEPEASPPAAKAAGGEPQARPAPEGSAAPSGSVAEKAKRLFPPETVERLPRAGRQPIASWEEAVAKAPAGQAELQSVMDKIAKAFNARTDVATPELLKSEDISGPDKFVFKVGTKGEKRSRQKVGLPPSAEHPKGTGEYQGDWSNLRDLLRTTVTVDDLDEVGKVVQILEDNGLTLAQKPKNRFADPPFGVGPTPEGYRDVNLVLQLPKTKLVGEVQLHLKPILVAKEKGHKGYEVQRDLRDKYNEQEPGEHWDAADKKAYADAQAFQVPIYEAAWEAMKAKTPATPSTPSAS